ncbi:MAG: 6-pyruvoyl trahydropterin synthase family protein [Pseudonocardiaceae bacterium]
MYLIAQQFAFSASHRLDGLDPGHPCSRDHGHNYTVRVALAADELDGTGFVADFHRLGPVKQYIAEALDHRNLNEVLPFQPSCECLARHFFDWCSANLEPALVQRLHHTAVSETATSWAVYSPVHLPAWGGGLG